MPRPERFQEPPTRAACAKLLCQPLVGDLPFRWGFEAAKDGVKNLVCPERRRTGQGEQIRQLRGIFGAVLVRHLALFAEDGKGVMLRCRAALGSEKLLR